jgi:hypothetical protein
VGAAARGRRRGGGSPLGVREDRRSPWGAVHSGGSLSREDQRQEVVQVVDGSDLGAVEGCGGGVELTVVNAGAEDDQSWWSLVRHPQRSEEAVA